MSVIAMVADSMDIGGAERHVITLSRELGARGHEIRLLCSAAGPLMTEALDAGIDICVLGDEVVKRRVSSEYIRFIAEELRRTPADIVHAHMFASCVAAAAALDGGRSRLVVTEHSEAVWRGAADEALASAVYGQCAAVIAVSGAIARRLIESDGVALDRVFTVPNAIGAIGYPSRSSSRRPKTAPVVGFIGRLRREKGVHHLLRAACSVLEAIPTARFVIVGDGPERARLEGDAALFGLSASHLQFLGERPDGPALLREFDVLAVPSVENEGTPLVVLEAVAAGVPVVASRTGGIPEQVRHGSEALLVEPGDPSALARALLEVLADPIGAERRATLAQQRLDTTFRLSTMVDAVEHVYRSTADRSSGILVREARRARRSGPVRDRGAVPTSTGER